MLTPTPKLPEDQKALVAVPQPIEVVLAEDLSNPVAFVLPPFSDIAEIEGLRDFQFSLHEFNDGLEFRARPAFKSELEKQLEKLARFGDAPVYLNRVAYLARFAGDAEAESNYLRRAYALENKPFYAHRLGENMLSAGSEKDAERFYAGLDLSSDLTANLRLASFCVKRGELNQAEVLVDNALKIDPLDFGARLFEGGMHLFFQRYEEAVHSLRLAVTERPTSSSVHCNLALAYLGVHEREKAFSSLKRSVALDPLNISAVMLMADLSFALKRDEEAIPSLRYFVHCEQKHAPVWSRLARACFRMGNYDETVAALKYQGSIEDSSTIWNNLGVTYQKKGLSKQALESYTHAMRVERGVPTKAYFLAARNVAQIMARRGFYKDLQKFSETMLSQDSDGIIPSDNQVSDLVIFHVYALAKQNEAKKVLQVTADYLALEGVSDSLAVWLVGALISYQALQGQTEHIDQMVELYAGKAAGLGTMDSERKERFFNNVAFAFAEMDRLDDAQRYMQRVIHSVHKSAYPTATFGLIQMKMGRIDRGVSLYEEAVRLASTTDDALRIKQKLNLELGKHWQGINDSKARRFLEKVVGQRGGEEILEKQALGLIRSLTKR